MRSDDGGSSTQIAESSDRGMAPSLSPRICADGTSTATERLPGTTAQRRPRSAGLRYGVSRNDYVPTIYERTDRRGLPAPQIALANRPPPGVSLCRGCTRAGKRLRKPHLAHVSTPKSPQIGPSLTPGRSTLPPTRRVMPWRRLVYAGYRTHGLSKLRRSPRGLGILPRVFGYSLLVRGDSAGRTDRAARTRRSTGIRARPRA
jgi:hypothetical protein